MVLAHPAYYPASFPRLAPLLHGYERRNKNGFPFEPDGCSLPCFSNSDLHWQDEQGGWERPVPLYCNYLTRRQLALFEG